MVTPGMCHIRRWAVILLVLGLASGRGDGLARAAPPILTALAASPTVDAVADGVLLEWRAPLPDLTRRADGTIAMVFRNLGGLRLRIRSWKS